MLMVANIVMFALGALSGRFFSRILGMPEPILMGLILLFSLVGAFVVRGNPVDVTVCAVAGVAGVVLRFGRYPIAPIVIGMALGATFETKLRQGLISARGDFLTFVQDPIALSVLGLTAIVLLVPVLKRRQAQ